jgi:hypothetical protein
MLSKKTKELYLKDQTFSIILESSFGKKNKTVQEKFRCFILSKYINLIIRYIEAY